MSSEPFVSCVMPTCDRRDFIEAAIRCYQEQTYRRRELVILDDGKDHIQDLVPDDPSIRYLIRPAREKMVTGAKRNLINSLAAAELIANWDDDDWSAPERLEEQVERLLMANASITGYHTLLFWDTLRLRPLIYQGVSTYACGTSLLYRKDYWRRNPYPAWQSSSDNAFVQPAGNKLVSVDAGPMMVARIHDRHTSPKDGIKTVVSQDRIPNGFIQNERFRLKLNR